MQADTSPDNPQAQDDSGDDYADEIATFFLALRGSGLFLSPADSALIVEWREAGLPLATVLAGLHRGAARLLKRQRPLRSLRSVRRDVLNEARRRGRVPRDDERNGPSQEVEVAPPPAFEYDKVRSLVRAHIDALESLSSTDAPRLSLVGSPRTFGIPRPLVRRTSAALNEILEADDFGPGGPVSLLLELGRDFYEELWASLEDSARAEVDAFLRQSLGERLKTMSAEARDETLRELESRALRESVGLFNPIELFELWRAP